MIEKILIEINRLKNELDGYSAGEALDYIESYINTLSKQDMESYEKIKKVLALGFMNFLDDNKSKGKMCLSNGECADIEKAFNEQDWPRLAGYLDKYILSTLESEKPIDLDELMKEAQRYYSDNFEYLSSDQPTLSILTNIARHFAEWGAEHLANAGKTLEIKPGDEVTINGHKFVYDKDKGYVKIVKSEELVPNDLEEAADNHIRSVADAAGHPGWDWTTQDIADAFIAGAKWQAEHTPLPEDTVLFNKGVEEGKRLMIEEFEGNRLAACDSQIKEEYDRETDFVDSIIKKEHRQPTFSDAINYGMRLQKEQMMNGVVEGTVYDNGDYTWVAGDIPSQFKYGDKVRVIVCKKED